MPTRHARYTLQQNIFIEIAADNPSRQFFSISNIGNSDILINFASVENSTLDGGLIIPPLNKDNSWQMSNSAVYTGIISAAGLASEGTIEILVLEY